MYSVLTINIIRTILYNFINKLIHIYIYNINIIHRYTMIKDNRYECPATRVLLIVCV